MKRGFKKRYNGKYTLIFFIFLTIPIISQTAIALRPLPDLYIDDARLMLEQNAGTLRISIGNNGAGFPEEKVELELIFRALPADGGRILHQEKITIPYDKLAPGNIYDIDIKEGVPQNPFVLNIVIDPSNKTAESNENNNTFRKVFTPSPAPGSMEDRQCNLAIGKFHIVPVYGNKVLLRIHILNLGTLPPANDFLVTLTWDPSSPSDKNSWHMKARSHPPGSEVIISSGYIILPKSGAVTFKAVIDPEGKIKESDKQDNQKTLVYTIPS